MPQSSGSLSVFNSGDFFRRAIKIFIVASLVNFPWEVAEIVFYDFQAAFLMLLCTVLFLVLAMALC